MLFERHPRISLVGGITLIGLRRRLTAAGLRQSAVYGSFKVVTEFVTASVSFVSEKRSLLAILIFSLHGNVYLLGNSTLKLYRLDIV